MPVEAAAGDAQAMRYDNDLDAIDAALLQGLDCTANPVLSG